MLIEPEITAEEIAQRIDRSQTAHHPKHIIQNPHGTQGALVFGMFQLATESLGDKGIIIKLAVITNVTQVSNYIVL